MAGLRSELLFIAVESNAATHCDSHTETVLLRLPTINKEIYIYIQSIKKYNSVEHLQRQQFSFTKTNEYLRVSKNPQVFTSKFKD